MIKENSAKPKKSPQKNPEKTGKKLGKVYFFTEA